MAEKRYSITEREWGLLDGLTGAAKMDWFCEETAGKGYLTEDQVQDSSCAFLAENFYRFTREEIMEIREFYVRCGVPAGELDGEIARWDSGEGDAGEAEVP